VFARLKTFNKAPGGQIGEYTLDANDSFAMSVDFANGALGVVHATRWATGHLNELKLRVYGERGGIEVSHRPNWSELRVCVGDDVENATWTVIEVPPVPTNYQRFADAVTTGVPQDPNFRHAANLQKVLDLALVTESQRREMKV
jgi:predicted dehydrogenase